MMTLLRMRMVGRAYCHACPLVGSALDDIVIEENDHPTWPTRYPTKFYSIPLTPQDREVLWIEAMAYWDDEREYPERMMRESAMAERAEKDDWYDEYQRTHASMADELKIPKKRGRPKNNPG